MPLHMGHRHLLDAASYASDQLTIVVCSLSHEPISGDLRTYWMKKVYPNARVVNLNDDSMPQDPNEHPDFWNIWKAALKKIHPEDIDVLFSSEEYGERLSKELNAKHHCVDLNRKLYPISATEIRNNPIKNWNFIPNRIRPYFVKNVLITGPESVGKSVLSENLAKHYETNFTPEYAREHLKEKLFDFNINDLEIIARNQHVSHLKNIFRANKICFSDTSSIETHLYSHIYLGTSSPKIDYYLPLVKYVFDLAILLTPETPWVKDNLRNREKERWDFFSKNEKILQEFGVPFKIISGKDFADRTKEAILATDELMLQPTRKK